jgi:hypothetical protein
MELICNHISLDVFDPYIYLIILVNMDSHTTTC